MELRRWACQTITASAAMAGMGAALLIPEFFEQEIARPAGWSRHSSSISRER